MYGRGIVMRWYVLTKGKQILRREKTFDDAMFYAYTHYAKKTNPYKYLYVVSEKDYNAKNWEAVIEVNDRDFILKNGKVVRREKNE
jgi:hypothetical protein